MAAPALVAPEPASPASRRGQDVRARQANVRRTRRVRRFAVLVVVAALAGGGVALALRPPTVATVRVTRGTAIDAVYATGTAETVDRVTVKARVSGILVTLRVREGDLVRRGQVIAMLDSAALKYDLQKVRAEQWAASQQAAASSPQFESLEAQASVTTSELKTARDDAQRLKELVGTRAVPQVDLDRAVDRVAALESRLAFNKAQIRGLHIDLAARSAGAIAAAGSASARLDEAEVRSPISGTVLGKFVDEGEVVGVNQPLLRIGDVSNFILECGVDEADVARVSLGSAALVSMQAFPDRPLEGTVTEILPDADRVRKTFLVKVKLVDPPAGLRSGMTSEVNIIASKHSGVLMIPGEALSSDGFAWVVRNGRAQRQRVKAGLRDLARVEVLSGLSEGDELVLSGLEPTEPPKEGQRVKAVARAVPAATATAEPPSHLASSAASSPAPSAASAEPAPLRAP